METWECDSWPQRTATRQYDCCDLMFEGKKVRSVVNEAPVFTGGQKHRMKDLEIGVPSVILAVMRKQHKDLMRILTSQQTQIAALATQVAALAKTVESMDHSIKFMPPSCGPVFATTQDGFDKKVVTQKENDQ